MSALPLVFAAFVVVVAGKGCYDVQGVKRTLNGVEMESFLGLRYATAERFASPRLMRLPKRQVVNATKPGPSCPNTRDPLEVQSEDCLFLNIHRVAGKKGLPVMVWLHGGAFEWGTGSTYDAAPMLSVSTEDVIVVTVNYRMGSFGFLGHHSMLGPRGTGNMGLQDQRAALRWVNRYIRHFGGDKHRVTLFGQSAGGASASSHMVSPRSRHLFSRVAISSGPAPLWGTRSMAHASYVTQVLMQNAGCGDIDCLRGLSMAELLAAQKPTEGWRGGYFLPWGVTIDGVEFTKPQWEHIRDGEYNKKVTVLAGAERDEAVAYWASLIGKVDREMLTLGVLGFVRNASAVEPGIALYSNLTRYRDIDLDLNGVLWWIGIAMGTDAAFFCQDKRVLQWMSGHGTRIYAYMNVHPTQTPSFTIFDGPGQVTVPHGAMLPYIFNCPSQTCFWANEGEAQLAKDVVNFWTSFAVTGAPGGEWSEPYSLDTKRFFLLDTAVEHNGTGFRYADDPRAVECAFWDDHIPEL